MERVMEVVYHVPIMEKLCTAVTEAGLTEQKIKKFVLTEEEYKELRSHDDYKFDPDGDDLYYYGVPITREQ